MTDRCQGTFDEALLSGYLDGTLSQGEEQKVRLHLEECEACRALYQEMLELREVTSSTEFVVPESGQWPALPQSVWSRWSRGLGWTMLVAWLLVVSGFALWRAVSGSGDPLELFLVLGLPGAFVLLFVSVVVDRLRELKTDRYRNVQR